MNSKEALRNIVRLSGMGGFLKKEEEIIKQDLDRLEQIEKENTELKQLVKEQFEKIQRDSGKMASMDCELRRLKGEFIPQECEG